MTQRMLNLCTVSAEHMKVPEEHDELLSVLDRGREAPHAKTIRREDEVVSATGHARVHGVGLSHVQQGSGGSGKSTSRTSNNSSSVSPPVNLNGRCSYNRDEETNPDPHIC